MDALGGFLIVLGVAVGGYYFSTAFLHRMDRPRIYAKHGRLAHAVAWTFLGLSVLGIKLVLRNHL